MIRMLRPCRWPVWAAMLALLLQGAMPAFAAAASRWQGKPLVEVCTLYGVAWVALDDDAAAASAGGHGDRCPLASLGAAPAPAPLAMVVLSGAVCGPSELLPAPAPPRDAVSAWQAGLAHGPPPAA